MRNIDNYPFPIFTWVHIQENISSIFQKLIYKYSLAVGYVTQYYKKLIDTTIYTRYEDHNNCTNIFQTNNIRLPAPQSKVYLEFRTPTLNWH